MGEILSCRQRARWVEILHLAFFWLLALDDCHFICLDQVLKAVLEQVEEPAEYIVASLEAPDQLRLTSLLLVEDLSVLRTREVQVLVEIGRFDCALLTFRQRLDEEGDYAKEAILVLKELNVTDSQVSLEPLERLLGCLAFLVLLAHETELWIVLTLGCQVVAHFNLEKASQREYRAHQEWSLLEHFDLRVQEGRVKQDTAQAARADHLASTVDELSDGQKQVHLLVCRASANLLEEVEQDVVDNQVDLLLRHDKVVDTLVNFLMRPRCTLGCEFSQWLVANRVLVVVIVRDLEDLVEELVGLHQQV